MTARPSVLRELAALLAVVLAGVAQAFALAWPFASVPSLSLTADQPSGLLQLLALALGLWVVRAAPTGRRAVLRGWVLATAWLAATFWWLYVSMHTYGGLPAPLAAFAVWALAACLALYYAVALALWWRWRASAAWSQALALAALWTFAELARATWFTGFPWGAIGYAHADTLTALAPWLGVYGIGAVAAVLAALAAALPSRAWRGGLLGLCLAGGLWWSAGGDRLRETGSDAGGLAVRLLQGNIAQDEKFSGSSGLPQALSWYGDQIRAAVARPQPTLVVAPETAIPQLPQQQPLDYWRPLWRAVADGRGAVLLGLPLGDFEAGYTNSVWGWTPDAAARALQAGAAPAGHEDPPTAALQAFHRYDKSHLVPFGEFIPTGFRWFVRMMNIPLGDFARGGLGQPPLAFGGQRLAPNICYEDLFGEELAVGFADTPTAPTVLVNLSNIAWFGDTVAIAQHLQISRLRAMELGRPMLRATNTGATAVIDHTGRVTHALPRLTRGGLDAEVRGREGLTPFARWAARWGLWPLGLGAALLLALAWAGRRRP